MKAAVQRHALAAAAALTILSPALAAAQTALPPARQLLDRYIAEIGGRDAVLDAGSIHTVGEFSMPSVGLTGRIESFQRRPDKSYTRVDIDGFGETRRGYDGAVGWSINPMEGPRLVEGEELKQMRDDADARAMFRDDALVASLETVELTEMNGQPCYRVRVVWRSGRETSDCYSPETGLLVGSIMTAESPMGSVVVNVFYGEYRRFGALRLPTSIRQQTMGQEQLFTVQSVEFGNVDPSVFELPDEIRALRR